MISETSGRDIRGARKEVISGKWAREIGKADRWKTGRCLNRFSCKIVPFSTDLQLIFVLL